MTSVSWLPGKRSSAPFPTVRHLNKIRLASSTLGKGGRRELWKRKEKKGLSMDGQLPCGA